MELLEIKELDLERGKALVRIARNAIKRKLKLEANKEQTVDPVLDKYGMAFVTLEKLEGEKYELRGCIGYVEAVAPLREVVEKAAIAAAFSDPRFPPLRREEMSEVVVEVTVLTKPQVLEVEDRTELPNHVRIGEDGLIVERGITHAGLLLPQVASEYCWDSETFLAETCIKAGLMPDCWLDRSIKVKKFQGVIFREVEPEGHVVFLRPSDVKCKSELTSY